MSLVNFKNYSKSDKIKLMEELWQDLINENHLETPQWHEKILEERLERYKKGELKTYTLDEVKNLFPRQSSTHPSPVKIKSANPPKNIN